jgi:hypothetical protein
MESLVGWAKARSSRAVPTGPAAFGGHTSLCPPYGSFQCDQNPLKLSRASTKLKNAIKAGTAATLLDRDWQ